MRLLGAGWFSAELRRVWSASRDLPTALGRYAPHLGPLAALETGLNTCSVGRRRPYPASTGALEPQQPDFGPNLFGRIPPKSFGKGMFWHFGKSACKIKAHVKVSKPIRRPKPSEQHWYLVSLSVFGARVSSSGLLWHSYAGR
jgi:hypothetical protein